MSEKLETMTILTIRMDVNTTNKRKQIMRS
jgi:hypothetical protein